MVVQREIILRAVTETSAVKTADDIGNPPLFGPFDLRHLKSEALSTKNSDVFKKLEETIKALHDSHPAIRSSMCPSSLHLRLRAVTVLRCLHLFFSGTSDVFATSISILDKFMSLIKIQEKYLSCVAGACYFISSKVYLEEEEIPTASELAYLHGNKWTSSDLCRMEAVILKKLNWNIPQINYLTFLRLFEKLFAQVNNQGPRVCLESQINLAESLIKLDNSILFKPSTLALCVLNHILEKQAIDGPTRTVLIQIQSVCDIHDSELFECKDLLCQNQNNCNRGKQTYQRSSINFPFKIRSRPSSEGESELPSISEVNSY